MWFRQVRVSMWVRNFPVCSINLWIRSYFSCKQEVVQDRGHTCGTRTGNMFWSKVECWACRGEPVPLSCAQSCSCTCTNHLQTSSNSNCIGLSLRTDERDTYDEWLRCTSFRIMKYKRRWRRFLQVFDKTYWDRTCDLQRVHSQYLQWHDLGCESISSLMWCHLSSCRCS